MQSERETMFEEKPGEKGNATFHVMGLQNHFCATGSHTYWEDITNVKIHESNEVLADVRDLGPTVRRPPKHGVLSHQEPANVLLLSPKNGRLPTSNFVISTSPISMRRLWTKMGKLFKSPIASQIWWIPQTRKIPNKWNQRECTFNSFWLHFLGRQWSQRGRDVEPPETVGFGSPHCRTRCPFRWSNQDEALEWFCCICTAAKKIGKYNPIQTNWQMMVHECTVNDSYIWFWRLSSTVSPKNCCLLLQVMEPCFNWWSNRNCQAQGMQKQFSRLNMACKAWHDDPITRGFWDNIAVSRLVLDSLPPVKSTVFSHEHVWTLLVPRQYCSPPSFEDSHAWTSASALRFYGLLLVGDWPCWKNYDIPDSSPNW